MLPLYFSPPTDVSSLAILRFRCSRFALICPLSPPPATLPPLFRCDFRAMAAMPPLPPSFAYAAERFCARRDAATHLLPPAAMRHMPLLRRQPLADTPR